jgi:hypothetical protein
MFSFLCLPLHLVCPLYVSRQAAQNPGAPSPISFFILSIQAVIHPFSSGSLPIVFDKVLTNFNTEDLSHPLG